MKYNHRVNSALCEKNRESIGGNMSLDIDSKVIGYFAFNSPLEVVCEGDAGVISGSEQDMRNYLNHENGCAICF